MAKAPCRSGQMALAAPRVTGAGSGSRGARAAEVRRTALPVQGCPEAARTVADDGQPGMVLAMADQLSRSRWSDPALQRAIALAGLVILLLLLPVVLGMQPQGAPSFDVTLDPAGPLPF